MNRNSNYKRKSITFIDDFYFGPYSRLVLMMEAFINSNVDIMVEITIKGKVHT